MIEQKMALPIPTKETKKKRKRILPTASGEEKQEFIPLIGRPVRTSELIFFTTQLSLMLEIGTPLHTALGAIAKELNNERFTKVLKDLMEAVSGGSQFSEALRRHPRIFQDIFISMVSAGEKGSFLKNILERLSLMQSKKEALKNQLQSALTYPVILSLVGITVVIFILTGVLPKFTVFFEGKEDILPFTTRFLMQISQSIRNYWGAYIGTVMLALSLSIAYMRNPLGKRMTDRILISFPVISPLMNKLYTGEMLRTLGYLLQSSVPLIEALKVTYPTIRNSFYRDFILDISRKVEEGGRFSHPFSQPFFLPETVKQMVSVGEEVGRLPVVLLRLADHYEREVDQELKRFSALIEPLALIFLGAIIGMMVSSIILPMFKIARAIH